MGNATTQELTHVGMDTLGSLSSCDQSRRNFADLANAALDVNSPHFEARQRDYFVMVCRNNRHLWGNHHKIRLSNRILRLPCGCCRDAPHEGDRNSSWSLAKVHGQLAYIHKECKKEGQPGTIVLEYSKTGGGWIIPPNLLPKSA